MEEYKRKNEEVSGCLERTADLIVGLIFGSYDLGNDIVKMNKLTYTQIIKPILDKISNTPGIESLSRDELTWMIEAELESRKELNIRPVYDELSL